MKYFIVWNKDMSEGFITLDEQLAYEIRKSADSNCFDANGCISKVGVTFCDVWADDQCTIQEIDL